MRVLVLGLLLFSSVAISSTQTGRIERLIVRDDGLHWVVLEGSRTKPACASGHDYWMIKAEDSRFGKSQFAMLLSAVVSGRAVTIRGTGECTRWVNGEDIETVILRQQ